MTDVSLSISALIVRRLLRVESIAAEVTKQVGPKGDQGTPGAIGPQGEQGPQGEKGEPGLQGKVGATGMRGLPGVDGAQGDTGPQGEQGQQGARGINGSQGEQGPQGEKGDTGPAPAHEWQGTQLRFKRPDGKWGKLTDLKGTKGDGGGVVVVRGGGGSSSGGGMSDLLPGNPNVEPTGIAVVQGGQWVNLSWPAFIQTIAGAIDMGVELSRRSDFVGETIIYRGEAAPGSAESATVWRIKRIEFVTGGDGKQDIQEKWANGNADFTNAWTDRSTINYL